MRLARTIACLSAAGLLAAVTGCGAKYAVTANGDHSAEVEMGHKVHVELALRGAGCGSEGEAIKGTPDWMIAPQTGASIRNGMFIATEPGTYKVTAPIPGDDGGFAEPVTIVVRGKRIAEVGPESSSVVVTEAAKEPVQDEPAEEAPKKPEPPKPLTVDTSSAKQAAPSTIELVFASANARRTSGGGEPATFTLKESRRIRMLESYHFVYGGSAPDAGYFTLVTEKGVVLGPFLTTRVVDGRTGMKNAYWYADVDFVLPAGTYTFHDSDPATWSQNAGTRGIGFCGVSALKK